MSGERRSDSGYLLLKTAMMENPDKLSLGNSFWWTVNLSMPKAVLKVQASDEPRALFASLRLPSVSLPFFVGGRVIRQEFLSHSEYLSMMWNANS